MNSIKLKVVETKRFVDEDKKVVATVIFDNLNNRFTGKASCSPDDKFDLEVGSKLSYLRAKEKMYLGYVKAYNKVIKERDKELKQLESVKDSFNSLQNDVSTKIKELVG